MEKHRLGDILRHMATYNIKDIYLERATANQTFEEYPLRVRPDCFLVTDTTSSVSLMSTSSFTASYAKFAGTSSYAFTSSIELQIELSTSFASASISSSFSNSASFATRASQSTTSVTASFAFTAKTASLATIAIHSDTSTSASYAPSSGGTFDLTQVSTDIRNPNGTLNINQFSGSSTGNSIQLIADDGDVNINTSPGQILIQSGVDTNDLSLNPPSTPNKIIVSGKAGTGYPDDGISIIGGNNGFTGGGVGGSVNINITAGSNFSDLSTGGNVNIQAGHGGNGGTNGNISLIGVNRIDVTPTGIGFNNQVPSHTIDVIGDINFTDDILHNGLPFTASAANTSSWSTNTLNYDFAPYNNGSVAGTVTLDRNNGIFQKLTVSNDITLNPPTNGNEGKILKLWIICGGVGKNLTMNASILIPSDSALTWPKVLTANKYYVVLLQYNGTNWMLNSIVGGY